MNEKIEEYDNVSIVSDFQDIPAGSEGVVLLLFEEGRHIEIEFHQIECNSDSYTVPINIVKKL